jgi:hypothetical protein
MRSRSPEIVRCGFTLRSSSPLQTADLATKHQRAAGSNGCCSSSNEWVSHVMSPVLLCVVRLTELPSGHAQT